MTILGIHDGHNASACLMKDGKIIAALQEERITRLKNQRGMPVNAIKWVLNYAQISPVQVDRIAIASKHMFPVLTKDQYLNLYKNSGSLLSEIIKFLMQTPIIGLYTKFRQQYRKNILINLGFENNKIQFIDHHLCHAACAYYGWGKLRRKVLVLTNDGSGDGLCATVNIGEEGRLKRIASIKNTESIANLYGMVTFLMGMVPQEHEYKLMGMAPYADQDRAKEVYSIFKQKYKFNPNNPMKWHRINGMKHFHYAYLRDLLELKRFDAIMGGIQLFIEDMLVRWVKKCIELTNIKDIAVAGGIFMNVKANKRIMALPEVKSFFVYPSCSDETIAIGACYQVCSESDIYQRIKNLRDLYFGPDYSDIEIARALKSFSFKNMKMDCKKTRNIEKTIAKLLQKGEIVARFAGREEFGARALGNRSILAHPGKTGLIRVLNKAVKNRDFWMPFACSILDYREKDYLINTKSIAAPYMILSFDTTDRRKEIAAGIHPYDYTVRPQVVFEKFNPRYYKLIQEFEKLTGVGAVLNTSFNLHGYPIVHTPVDALRVLDNSGLKYLAIGDYLVTKV